MRIDPTWKRLDVGTYEDLDGDASLPGASAAIACLSAYVAVIAILRSPVCRAPRPPRWDRVRRVHRWRMPSG